MRVQKLGKCGNTCCKSTSSNRYQDIIYQWEFLYDLHGDGSLSGGYCRVVKRMDKGISVLLCKLKRMGTCLIVNISVKDDFRSVALSTLHLDQWRGGRHDNDGFYSVFMCSIGNALCMVSCRCCDQTFVSLFVRKCADLIICATYFICTGALHILRFQVNLVSCHIREIAAVYQLCFLCHFFYFCCRFFKAF